MINQVLSLIRDAEECIKPNKIMICDCGKMFLSHINEKKPECPNCGVKLFFINNEPPYWNNLTKYCEKVLKDGKK